MVVVCRSLDYDGHLSQCYPRFTVLEISPWSEDQVSAFLMRQAPELLPALTDPKLRTDLLDLGQIPQVLMLLVDAVRSKSWISMPWLEIARRCWVSSWIGYLITVSKPVAARQKCAGGCGTCWSG